jgi:8-oxo-dGTP pyrophosphatase MutT (NUDIX family)
MALTPTPAATVILMRETSADSVQAFLLKRHEASAFMGGNFVYPGGRMEPEDEDEAVLPHCRGLDPGAATAAREGDTDRRGLLGYPICALRELFEEAGILLAYSAPGELCATDSPPDKDRFGAYRRLIEAREMSMIELARRENLFYAFDQLFYVDRWITPEARNIRFDTRFYLAFCPEGQQASSDQTETVQGLWMSPPEALEANLKGSIALSPPTLETLEALAPFDNRESILRFLKDRKPRTVLPILTKAVDGPVILFPWDEEYESLHRGETTRPRPSRLRNPDEKTSRVLLKDGHWLPGMPKEGSR